MENRIKVENNVFVLKSDNNDFLAKRMTEQSNKELRKNLNEYNRYFDSIGNDLSSCNDRRYEKGLISQIYLINSETKDEQPA
ncbi:hypothetical protein [Pedobacter sp. NJ-S-72]